MSLSEAEFAALAPVDQWKGDPARSRAIEIARYKAHRAARPIPPSVRMVVHERAKGCCEECGEFKSLELHHLTYSVHNLAGVVGSRPDKGYAVVVRDGRQVILYEQEGVFGNESPDDLRALCRDCHHARHIVLDEFYADIDEADSERDYIDHIWRD